MSPKLQNRLLKIAFDLRHICQSDNKHISFLLDKNKIMSMGFNSNFKHSKLIRGMGFYAGSRHSEVDSYLNLQNKEMMPYLTLVNIRLSKLGNIGMSLPCSKCMHFLNAMCPRKIFYTTREGNFARYL